MFKVDFYTLGVMPDGTVGNVEQSRGTCYTDFDLSEIERELNWRLALKKRVAVVTKAEAVTGTVLAKGGE